MNEVLEHTVLRKVAQGDEGALVEIFEDHAQVLFNLAARVLPPASDSGGAVLDLFLSLRDESSAALRWEGPLRRELLRRMREMLTGRSADGTRRYPIRDLDLWSVVSRPIAEKEIAGMAATGQPGSVASVRWILRKSGSVTSAVVSLIYFGGFGVAEAAARLGISPSECRSRLHGCLELLLVDGPVPHEGHSDHAMFSVGSSARALGAITPAEEPDYFEHLAGGCPVCEADIARYSAAAQILPMLLPDSKLPRDLKERLHSSLHRARATPAAADALRRGAADGDAGPDALRSAGPEHHEIPSPERSASGKHPARGSNRRGLIVTAGVAALAVIASLGLFSRSLLWRLDEQSALVEQLQDRQTELLLERDRLTGISGLFESKGIVVVLDGSESSPDAAGKIVWDTTLGRGMIQLLNFPAGAGERTFQVRAAGSGRWAPIAEFRRSGSDSGAVFYRFFETPREVPFPVEGFTVVAPARDLLDSAGESTLLRGSVTGRW